MLDDIGPGTEPVRFCVDVTIKGDEAVVDFSRSSDQVTAGINSYINYTRAYATFSIRTFAKVDVPHNDGVERPIRTVARKRSFFNPEYPAPQRRQGKHSGSHLRCDQRRASEGAAGARDGRILALGQPDLRRACTTIPAARG